VGWNGLRSLKPPVPSVHLHVPFGSPREAGRGVALGPAAGAEQCVLHRPLVPVRARGRDRRSPSLLGCSHCGGINLVQTVA
jgi:hypothetical protein